MRLVPQCVDQMDQSCVAVCPADCITNEPGVDRKLYIDPDECIECGSCYSACPNEADLAERLAACRPRCLRPGRLDVVLVDPAQGEMLASVLRERAA